MRRPTDRSAAWGWWRDAIALGRRPVPDAPQCGLFKARGPDGRWVAASIDVVQPTDDAGELTGDEQLVCWIGGYARDADEAWPFLARHPVSEAEHRALLAAPRVFNLAREVIV
jgi:hypothetical protein